MVKKRNKSLNKLLLMTLGEAQHERALVRMSARSAGDMCAEARAVRWHFWDLADEIKKYSAQVKH